MPTQPRSAVVAPGEVAMYHCTSRCVRSAWLCGEDAASGRSYEHRKAWVQQRLMHLAEAYAIEVCAFSVMSNHMHLMLRTRPDLAAIWSNQEVAERWRTVCPSDQQVVAPSLAQIAEWRSRLANLSWFMRMLAEWIARKANREEHEKGRFWNGRFHCQALLDEAAILACTIYVDLNPIRAGVAKTPEESRYTSAYERIAARQAAHEEPDNSAATSRADWLCPLKLAARDEALPALEETSLLEETPIPEEATPKSLANSQRKGFLPLSLDEYLTLLDWTGRQVRNDKPCSIPADLAPILERLSIRANHWLDLAYHFRQHFRQFAGRPSSLDRLARKCGRRWYHGIRQSRKLLA